MSSKGPVMQIRIIFAALLLVTPAVAQPVSDQAVLDFVDSHSAITRQEKIARWEDPVCPAVRGLPANFVKFITKRIRDLAASVGAPVDSSESCQGNIDVVFTTTPNKLGEYEIGPLADHIAMLALAQPANSGACTELPSILDTTNPTCRKDAPVKALTKADTGYLKGLYNKIDAGTSLRAQKDAI